MKDGRHTAAKVFTAAKSKTTGVVDTAADRSGRINCGCIFDIETVGIPNARIRNAVHRDRALRVDGAGAGQQSQGGAEFFGVIVLIHEFVFQIVIWVAL